VNYRTRSDHTPVWDSGTTLDHNPAAEIAILSYINGARTLNACPYVDPMREDFGTGSTNDGEPAYRYCIGAFDAVVSNDARMGTELKHGFSIRRAGKEACRQWWTTDPVSVADTRLASQQNGFTTIYDVE
jgi:hypothetical protein